MGRSKKSGQAVEASSKKYFCYWCDKDFEQEEILIQHQIAKHFKCPHCQKGSGGHCISLEFLIVHFRKIHRAELLAVPNAKEGRNDPSDSQHIYGMTNVPEEVMQEWKMKAEDIELIVNPPAPATSEESIRYFGSNAVQGATQPVAVPKVAHASDARLREMRSAAMPAPLALSFAEFAAPGLAGLSGSSAMTTPANQDWSQSVAQWMMSNKAVEEPKPPPEPITPRQPASASRLPPQPRSVSSITQGILSDLSGSAPAFTGLSLGSGAGAQRVDSAASDAIAAFAERAKLAAASAPPAAVSSGQPAQQWSLFRGESSAAAAPQPQNVLRRRSRSQSRSRSRSRSRRSRSWSRGGRGRSRSRSRRDNRPKDARSFYRPPPVENPPAPAGGGYSASSFENRTLQIIEGDVPSRLRLKAEMEKFGRVETVYMGNRHDSSSDPPMIRFALSAAAEMAMHAFNTGQVVFDGNMIKAQYKTGGRKPAPRPIEREVDERLEASSRDLARGDTRRRNDDRRYDDRRYDDRRYDDRQGGGRRY